MPDGAKLPASAELTEHYNKAWELYQARCLWNVRREPHPTPGDARFVAYRLRQHGNMEARKLATRIEDEAAVADEYII